MPSIQSSPPRARGFTIIELLIVSPLVILIVAVMVGFAVSLTGDALIARERVNATYTAQGALDRIEQDVRLSTRLLATSGTLPTPQGSNSGFAGTSAFASPANYLVLEQYATTQNPYGATRSLVYYANQPNACGSAAEKDNETVYTKIIYYRDGQTLKRRVIVPTGTFCGTPWQRNSCKTGLDTGNQCRAADEIVAENVSALSFAYYTNPGDASAITSPSDTTRTVLATITVSQSIAGRSATATSIMRASTISIE